MQGVDQSSLSEAVIFAKFITPASANTRRRLLDALLAEALETDMPARREAPE